MLTHHRASAVLVSTDLERSQRFYEEKVGLTLSPETIRNHLLFDCGDGSTLLVYGPDDEWIPVRTSIDTWRRARRRSRTGSAGRAPSTSRGSRTGSGPRGSPSSPCASRSRP